MTRVPPPSLGAQPQVPKPIRRNTGGMRAQKLPQQPTSSSGSDLKQVSEHAEEQGDWLPDHDGGDGGHHDAKPQQQSTANLPRVPDRPQRADVRDARGGKETKDTKDSKGETKDAKSAKGSAGAKGAKGAAGAKGADESKGSREAKGLMRGQDAELMTDKSFARVAALAPAATKLTGDLSKVDRPPDAYAALKDAKEAGVLFREDDRSVGRDGGEEEEEDPALAEAVEECIRRCFGVKGILRINPGRNEKNEKLIVVVATHGFSQASMAKIPPEVHGFPTTTALPFDLLPLKRDA